MNGNEPIMPLVGVDKSKDLFLFNTNGLTKREYFAGLAMSNLVSNCRIENGNVTALGSITKIAIAASDALIAELDKTEKP